MQNHKDLRVWQLAQSLAADIIIELPEHRTRRAPGLRSQAVRAASSIHANIAEGCGRDSRTEFLRFLEIAMASLAELESHLELARRIGILPQARFLHFASRIMLLRRMLLSLRRTVERKLAESKNA